MCFDFISVGIQIFQSLPVILNLWYVSFEIIIIIIITTTTTTIIQFMQKSLLLWA